MHARTHKKLNDEKNIRLRKSEVKVKIVEKLAEQVIHS